MRLSGTLFIMGLLGLVVLVVETGGVRTASGEKLTTLIAVAAASPPSIVGGSELEVDRNDDPVAMLPCTDAPNDCNLRSAINLANSDGGPTTITFADHYRLLLSQPLPPLTEARTTIKALMGQEVHINANRTAASVLRILGAHSRIEGLRLYGAGAGYPTLAISGQAHSVIIANNVIGDDDAPEGDCASNSESAAGIYLDATPDTAGESAVVGAWIYGNIIECITGSPGVGIMVVTGPAIIGQDDQGQAQVVHRNVIRLNAGHAVGLGNSTGNTVRNNLIYNNQGGDLEVTNFNNDIMGNQIR